MNIESALFEILANIAAIKGNGVSRVYPDVPPDAPEFPLAVYQVTGGQAHDYLERKLPDCEHFRVQVVSWAKTRAAASALAAQARQHIIERGPGFKSARTIGQAVSLYEGALKIYGSRQDFSIWLKVR